MYEEIEKMGPRVGIVLGINGPRLMYRRRLPSGNVGNYQAYPGMPIYLNDHLETDRFTTASLEFTIGGQAFIASETEIVVHGQRHISRVGNQFLIKAGKMWSRIDKRNSQMQIQTVGGGGIEG